MGNDRKLAVLAFGANIGDCRSNIKKAVELLTEAGLKNIRLSSFYENKAQNCPPGTPDFVNAVALGECPFDAFKLLTLCRNIEIELGRPARHGKNTSRTIDIDIILLGDQHLNTPRLTIPHPLAHQRDFVLKPLAELAPELIEIIKKAAAAPQSPGQANRT